MRCFWNYVLIGTMLLLFSCSKESGQTPLGENYIYMPQSYSVEQGPSVYRVPSADDGGDIMNYRVDVANGFLEVFIGVANSGSIIDKDYTVDIITNLGAVEEAINSGSLDRYSNRSTVLLPEACFTVPKQVYVSKDKSKESFSLQIKLDCLKIFSSKNVALSIGIQNPSDFQINPNMDKMIVLIDISKLSLF